MYSCAYIYYYIIMIVPATVLRMPARPVRVAVKRGWQDDVFTGAELRRDQIEDL